MLHQVGGRRFVLAAGLAALLIGAGDPATADAPRDASVATAMTGVRTYGALPETFDPATASPERIAGYGLPPRPDRDSEPEEYAAWLRDVGPEVARAVPRLKATDVRNRRARDPNRSTNWSGVVLSRDVGRYGPRSFQSVHAAWTVPAVQPPYGTCRHEPNSGAYQMAIWPGIGGFEIDSLLQAGTAASTRCVDGAVEAEHWAWYEFYPYPSVAIETLPALPGHVISVYVWSTSARDGHAHVVNRTLNRSASFRFRPPAHVRLVGNSAEWIVERPESDGALSNLANYAEAVLYEATAATGRGELVNGGHGGADDGIRRIRNVMTTEAPHTVSLSVADVVGAKAIRFRNKGPSRFYGK